jgi:hypothetical protein
MTAHFAESDLPSVDYQQKGQSQLAASAPVRDTALQYAPNGRTRNKNSL